MERRLFYRTALHALGRKQSVVGNVDLLIEEGLETTFTTLGLSMKYGRVLPKQHKNSDDRSKYNAGGRYNSMNTCL